MLAEIAKHTGLRRKTSNLVGSIPRGGRETAKWLGHAVSGCWPSCAVGK